MEKVKKNKVVLTVIWTLVAAIFGSLIGAIAAISVTKLSSDEEKILKIYNILKDQWLYADDDIEAEAILGMVDGPATSKGDDYTFYTRTYEEQGLNSDGLGFGFSSRMYGEGSYITDVYNGPAYHKLQKGDVILSAQVEGEEPYIFKDHTTAEINAYMTDPKRENSTFKFFFKREGEAMTTEFKRGKYSKVLAESMDLPSGVSLPENTFAIKINTFLSNTAAAVKGLLDSYQGDIDHLIIDLRGNGGGSVEQARTIASYFVKKGTVIYEYRDKDNKVMDRRVQDKDPEYQIDHFSILLDGQTASASELMTMAMLNGTDTKTYGLKSFGKGIAQRVLTLADGSTLRYTFAKVYGPQRGADELICNHGIGISPDVEHEDDYVYHYPSINYSASLGISEYYQDYFLNVLNKSDDTYPSRYSETYHFTDAISDFAKKQSLAKAFESNGRMSLEATRAFAKLNYDFYLEGYENTTRMMFENL